MKHETVKHGGNVKWKSIYSIWIKDQIAQFGDGTLEFIVQNLNEDESVRANKIVKRAWDWVSINMKQLNMEET